MFCTSKSINKKKKKKKKRTKKVRYFVFKPQLKLSTSNIGAEI